MYELFSKGIKRLRELGEVLLSEELKEFKVLDSSLISSELKELSNFYKLKFDFGDFELRELRKA